MGNFIDDEYFCYADTAADAASCENNYVDRAINKIGCLFLGKILEIGI
jgi:hypothetical protein